MLVLVVNLVLAGSLVYKALAAYDVIDIVFGEGATVESHPARVELKNFVYTPQNFREKDPAMLVTRVSTDLQPPKRELPTVAKTEPVVVDPEDEVPAGPEELPEGPLAKEWEYVYYIVHGDSGLRNFAQLRKKKDEKSKSSKFSRPSSSRGRVTRSRAQTTVKRTSGSRYKSKAKADTVSFLVSDREIENEDFELHFWVHSATKEKLEYWMPGRPGKHYALPYKHEGSYLAQGPMRKELRPEEDEDDEEDEKEKKSFYLVHEDANPEEAREKRYERIAAGKTPESKFTPSSGKSSKARSKAGSGSTSSRLSPSSRRGPSKPTKEDDIKELKSVIEKIPPEKRAQLEKEFKGMLQGKKK